MTIQITVAGSPIEATAKKQALEQLGQLDSDTLTKLAELSKNPKAVAAFKNPPAILKTFLK